MPGTVLSTSYFSRVTNERNWSTERLSHLPKVTQLASGRAGFQSRPPGSRAQALICSACLVNVQCSINDIIISLYYHNHFWKPRIPEELKSETRTVTKFSCPSGILWGGPCIVQRRKLSPRKAEWLAQRHAAIKGRARVQPCSVDSQTHALCTLSGLFPQTSSPETIDRV